MRAMSIRLKCIKQFSFVYSAIVLLNAISVFAVHHLVLLNSPIAYCFSSGVNCYYSVVSRQSFQCFLSFFFFFFWGGGGVEGLEH